ncbi:MAG: 2-hydroxychromene-2-carboxylate isomerase [Pseudomonadota bacterium]|nr:2-hydroxychromene-2-carboxylate isomerase [Pseudomonadota bacterium]
MQSIDFWFDPISPYAYLAFERLPEAFERLSYSVRYRPVLFGAMLKHWDHKGPAEIEPKRAFTFRHVQWLAHRLGVPLQTPAQHPFNPLALLRLAHASAGPTGTPNRHVCAAILHHVWRGGGADANEPTRVEALTQTLAPRLEPNGDGARQGLKDTTAHAIEIGVFGVPTLGIDGHLFWGLDALEMASACLCGDPWFNAGGPWDEAGAPRPGIQRKR